MLLLFSPSLLPPPPLPPPPPPLPPPPGVANTSRNDPAKIHSGSAFDD